MTSCIFSISEDSSRNDDIEDVMEEVSQVALAKLNLPFTTAYMASSAGTSENPQITNNRTLEDIPEVESQEE